MPKKRKSTENTNKQEKLITSKLMAINYIVDDYVYSNKEISESDAKRYLQELESYKEICNNNVRCSQDTKPSASYGYTRPDISIFSVIEKLVRIMKTVVNDKQKSYVTDCYSNDFTFENTQMSPVYSTADKDRTQLNESLLDIMDDKVDKMDEGIDVIDLCSYDDEIPQQNSEHENIPGNVEVEIHKTLSSLSLTTNKNQQLTSAEVKYAKNTLANIADNEVINEKRIKQIPDKENFITKATEDITEVSKSKCRKSNVNCVLTTSTLQKTISDIQSINSQVNNTIPNQGNKNNTINKHSNILKFASLTPGSGHPHYKETNINDCSYNTVTNKLSKPLNNVLNAINQNYVETVKINDRSSITQTQQQNMCVISNKEIKAQNLQNGANINFTKVTGNIDKAGKAGNVINKKQRRKNIRENVNCVLTTSTLQKTISDIQSINSQVNNTIPNHGNKNNTINKHSNILKFASLTPGSGHPHYKQTNINDCSYNTVTNELSKPLNNVLNAINQNSGETVKVNDRSSITQTQQQNICVISNKEIKAQNLQNGANIKFTKVTGNIDKVGKAGNVINKKQRRKNIRENKDKKSIKEPAKRRNAKIKNNDNKNYNKALTKNVQIYNNTTEDNLSWIENIKFVREVHADEYDVQLKLEECFWDNYSLPSVWNEQDFNYSN